MNTPASLGAVGKVTQAPLPMWIGITPVFQQAATANPAATASDVTDSTGGTPSGTHALVDVATDTWDNEKADVENNFATLAAEYNLLKDDVEANNAAIDDLIAKLKSAGIQI